MFLYILLSSKGSDLPQILPHISNDWKVLIPRFIQGCPTNFVQWSNFSDDGEKLQADTPSKASHWNFVITSRQKDDLRE